MLEAAVGLEIPRDNIVFGAEIGSGEFGLVRRAFVTGLRNVDGPVEAAVKILRDQVCCCCLPIHASIDSHHSLNPSPITQPPHDHPPSP